MRFATRRRIGVIAGVLLAFAYLIIGLLAPDVRLVFDIFAIITLQAVLVMAVVRDPDEKKENDKQ